jgi:magnesium-transporting ATPase (P-type)
MVTGDHVRTAISVAHQCHILPVGRPVLLVDGPDPVAAAAGQPGGQASLSVLYPDGSVNDRLVPSTVLAQVGMSPVGVKPVYQSCKEWSA